ncbi:LytR family transcriptional regulator [Caldibacillus lycopersici]|uniref:Polyisoprenyl-teichoic acid--peptidoglycan teichoic acid transferase TagU n=1 Tax=Perspicuibacillus lycopersici TaxID=1325689 RepID=A0AAE3LSQ7_9BACI|nr:LytR family transcriptional regulator [Perspicuibacillus lycopersici]MCU9613003.1 LytR family transcriptional regulator [Perspicuibacillus lycopersici]
MAEERSRKNKKKMKKWVKVTLIILAILVVALGAYIFSVYHSLSDALHTMHQPIRETSDKRTEKVALEEKDPFSVLLLGVDERSGDRGRSDTMIVMAVNPTKESIEMISIPRDTRTEIVGKGTEDKINHAYAFGGVEMSINTVENFFDIPIDYFIQVNMEGFQEIVDAVGGVTVTNDLDFTYGGVHFPEGTLTLNGDEALLYSRMRKEDPRGDFGRQLRQRSIIEAVIKEGASLNTLTNYGDIFTALGNNVKTNLTFSEMIDIQKNYKQAAKDMEQHQINGHGSTINGIYYYIVPDEEKAKLQQLLKEQLEITE